MAVLNVFRMFSRMRGERVAASSSGAIALDTMIAEGVRGAPDVAAFASHDAATGKMAVMVWHYHDDDVPGPDSDVSLKLSGLPKAMHEARIVHYRVDETHSNSYGAWQRVDSPIAPNEEQYERLKKASELARLENAPESVRVSGGAATLGFMLPRQGVSLVVFELPGSR